MSADTADDFNREIFLGDAPKLSKLMLPQNIIPAVS